MRIGLRLGIAFVCLAGAAWTCRAMLRPRDVATMTFEQCLDLIGQGKPSPATALELAAHLRRGVAALRRYGPDGDVLLQQLAKDLAR